MARRGLSKISGNSILQSLFLALGLRLSEYRISE